MFRNELIYTSERFDFVAWSVSKHSTICCNPVSAHPSRSVLHLFVSFVPFEISVSVSSLLQLYIERHCSMSQSSTGSEPRTPSKGISASAAPFYPGASTVESVVGTALGDLNIDTGFDDFEVDDLSIASSVGTGGLGTSNNSLVGQFSNGSEPVTIPGSQSLRHSSFTSQASASPTSPGMGPSSSIFYSGSHVRIGDHFWFLDLRGHYYSQFFV